MRHMLHQGLFLALPFCFSGIVGAAISILYVQPTIQQSEHPATWQAGLFFLAALYVIAWVALLFLLLQWSTRQAAFGLNLFGGFLIGVYYKLDFNFLILALFLMIFTLLFVQQWWKTSPHSDRTP